MLFQRRLSFGLDTVAVIGAQRVFAFNRYQHAMFMHTVATSRRSLKLVDDQQCTADAFKKQTLQQPSVDSVRFQCHHQLAPRSPAMNAAIVLFARKPPPHFCRQG